MLTTTEIAQALEARAARIESRRDEADGTNQRSFDVWDQSELEYLQGVIKRLRDGETCEALKAWLIGELTRLESEVEREDHCPTFDWYDDHHFAKIYGGQLAACKSALAIMEGR